jgi:hypothetical protein
MREMTDIFAISEANRSRLLEKRASEPGRYEMHLEHILDTLAHTKIVKKYYDGVLPALTAAGTIL